MPPPFNGQWQMNSLFSLLNCLANRLEQRESEATTELLVFQPELCIICEENSPSSMSIYVEWLNLVAEHLNSGIIFFMQTFQYFFPLYPPSQTAIVQCYL